MFFRFSHQHQPILSCSKFTDWWWVFYLFWVWAGFHWFDVKSQIICSLWRQNLEERKPNDFEWRVYFIQSNESQFSNSTCKSTRQKLLFSQTWRNLKLFPLETISLYLESLNWIIYHLNVSTRLSLPYNPLIKSHKALLQNHKAESTYDINVWGWTSNE